MGPVIRGPHSGWEPAWPLFRRRKKEPKAAVRGFGEGFWGDNWAAIKCSRWQRLLPVTCQLRQPRSQPLYKPCQAGRTGVHVTHPQHLPHALDRATSVLLFNG